jgi:hypothetical protein
MQQTFGITARTLSAAAAALSMAVLCTVPMRAGAQSVALTITVDADTVEILRAWRRQQGLDPPDAQADERFAEWVRRRHAARSGAAVAAPPVIAPRAARDAPAQRPPRPSP